MAEIDVKPVDAVEDVDSGEPKNTETTCEASKEIQPDAEGVEDVEEFISKDNNVESSENSNKSPSSTELMLMEESKVQSVETEEPNKKEAAKCIDAKSEKDNSDSSDEFVLKAKPVEDNDESIKNDAGQVKPTEPNPTDSNIDEIITQEEEKLNEILKIVHNDLGVKDLKKDAGHINIQEKECSREEKEEEEVEEGKEKEDSSSGSESTRSESVKTMNKEDANVVNEVSSEIEPTKLSNNTDTEEVTEKSEEQSEVGIVGPPTTASELINEDELRAESVLSTESKTQDHVAEWVENSAKADVLITVATEEEENDIQNDNRHRRKNLGNKRSRKKKSSDLSTLPVRKSQRIVTNIIKKSIKCLNKMHAMEGSGGNGKKVDAAEKTREDDTSRASPKVPQSQQNGAALPEETAAATTAADRLRSSSIKKEPHCDSESESTTKNHSSVEAMQQKVALTRCSKSETESNSGSSGRKRKSTDGQLSSNGNSAPKKFCLEQREQYISSLVGCEKVTAEELAVRADQLRAEVQALDELARAKEMEWNEILSMRKLKEEAYLRIERRRQVMGYMEGNGQLGDTLPPASLSLGPEWESSGNMTPVPKEKCGGFEPKEDLPEENSQELPTFKKDKNSKSASQRQSTPPKQSGENGRKQVEALSPEYRQIGEGRQGAIVDVKSIIADHRLRHPETVPRRGRRMRNSVNVGLGAGGAMVETGHSVDSRPSSTDSCKSNPNAVDPNNSMSFKDVLVQFAKLSQQQGEPVKTPQNYPDVTLHPVAPSPVPQNTPPQQTGSLLHGILTKSQSPRPTTFSPTLARLLTAPERERNTPTATSIPQQAAATQHLLQAYQGSNPVSISDLLSSSKARTEITITPVVNTPVQSHSNNLIHVEDVEEESAVIEDRETRVSAGGRDTRDDRDSPPRCQGCHERAAQFVCAGCGNQWYCSRECQVAAWDEHSEVCSG